MKLPILLLFTALFCVLDLRAAEPPVEVGKVAWKRDFDAALKLSGKEGKPVLLLFQEVPG